MTAEREAIDRGWFYVVDPPHPPPEVLTSGDGKTLVRRFHGYPAHVEVLDRSRLGLPVAALLRAASAVGRGLERVGRPGTRLRVEIGPPGTEMRAFPGLIELDGGFVASVGSPFPLEESLEPLLTNVDPAEAEIAELGGPARRVLMFESLMNSDLPHNDKEISQGVLHMASSLRGMGTEVVLANVKMPITGDDRPVVGLEQLQAALAEPVDLICISLLEGYWHGVLRLIQTLRDLGTRAHIAVGGVMPSLSPAQVAAHLPEVSFVCRGAGEVFVPALARVVGTSTVDVPLSSAQRAALLEMRGLFVVDRAGKRLIAAYPAEVVRVPDLDRVELDLGYVLPRHIEGGIEIATSRGCIHRCSFCSILGRESYQARSAENVFGLLGRYEERYAELFGDHVPHNAYRVHFSDDDFGCDKDRALSFLRELRSTPFRLSSVQVSVADLCLREDGRLLPVVDPDWLEVLDPACFADDDKDIPEQDYVLDHRSRNWSSYLQIGVETFADSELVRLAKGYRLAHIEAVVAALAARRVHMDAYFIASNSRTTAWDLVDSLTGLCRLKLRHPRYFHLRFPIVPHLVSYFPAATFRRKVRQGRSHTLALRDHAQEPGYPEFDYPFVDHDVPDDPFVREAVGRDFLTDEGRYTASIPRLREVAVELGDEPLARHLDDLPRRLAFDLLDEARVAAREGVPGPTEAHATSTVTGLLGAPSEWVRAYKRFSSLERPRLVVIPTWQCELRCQYCYIPKQDGRVMTERTMERSVDLLLSSSRRQLMLQFFGGEALIEYELVQHGMTYAMERAAVLGKEMSFVLSSNGWSLDEEKLAWLGDFPVKLELSLDGDRETQNEFRRAYRGRDDSYDLGIAPRADAILASGLHYDVIMVVHPRNVHKMPANFFHIASLGFERIQINFALGSKWSAEQKKAFADGLFTIGSALRDRWAEGRELLLVNLENKPMPIKLNAEITVDWDGTVYGGNAFLHETEHKDKFVIGHLDDLGSFDRYWMDAPTNEFLLDWSYKPDVTTNNLDVGKVFTSFLRWMYKERPQPRG